jgi:hypothetical protein
VPPEDKHGVLDLNRFGAHGTGLLLKGRLTGNGLSTAFVALSLLVLADCFDGLEVACIGRLHLRLGHIM